jgi:hypothetical protein
MASKNTECLGCGKKFAQKDSSVRCSVCKLWCHKTCAGLTDEFFKCLVEQYKATKRTYWACRACGAYAEGMNHRLMEIQEQTTEAIRIGRENTDEINKLNEMVVKERERADNAVMRMEKEMQEEMTRREERRKNVVLHGLQESNQGGGRDRMEADKRKLDEIFTILDVNVAADNDVEFCRRLGEKSDRPRPLVVGFYYEWSKEVVLKHARKLMTSNHKEVTIVQDLTDKQRRAEKELMQEAERRNMEELSEEDLSKNLEWRVVGKKGQKRLLKTMNTEQWQQQRGRGRPGPYQRGGVGAVQRGGAAQGGGAFQRGGVAMRGAALLPPMGPRGTWSARLTGQGRGGGGAEAATEQERSSSRKRGRQGSNEDQAVRPQKRGARGAGRPVKTRGVGRGAPVRGREQEGAGGLTQEEEVLTQNDQPSQTAEEMDGGDGEEEEEEEEEDHDHDREEEEEEMEGLRLGESQQQ